MLDSGEYPDTWAEGLGVPVPKGGDKHDPSTTEEWQLYQYLGNYLKLYLIEDLYF